MELVKNLTKEQISILQSIQDTLRNNIQEDNPDNEVIMYNKDIIESIIADITYVLYNIKIEMREVNSNSTLNHFKNWMEIIAKWK